MEQEILTLQQHLISPLVFSGVRVARSLIFCVVYCRWLFVLLSFFFWPLCCPLIYGFWLPLWDLQLPPTHPKDQSCEVSLKSDQFFYTFMVSMATTAILNMSNPKCTSTHPKNYSCEVSLQSKPKDTFPEENKCL